MRLECKSRFQKKTGVLLKHIDRMRLRSRHPPGELELKNLIFVLIPSFTVVEGGAHCTVVVVNQNTVGDLKSLLIVSNLSK